MNEVCNKQKDRVDELSAEIRKLKAMIVKHESRIRSLESKNRELEELAGDMTGSNNNNGNNIRNVSPNVSGMASDEMDPDEV